MNAQQLARELHEATRQALPEHQVPPWRSVPVSRRDAYVLVARVLLKRYTIQPRTPVKRKKVRT